MKYLLLAVIRIYWFLIPPSKRRKCIFRTSCSKYVYGITINKGIVNGCKALFFRIKNCNCQFDIYKDIASQKRVMQLKSGTIIKEEEISERLL